MTLTEETMINPIPEEIPQNILLKEIIQIEEIAMKDQDVGLDPTPNQSKDREEIIKIDKDQDLPKEIIPIIIDQTKHMILKISKLLNNPINPQQTRQDIKPEEIFMRWYLNSLIKGGKDYFMPISFNALENDLTYHEKSLSSNITKEEICAKINEIFQKYCTQEYCIKKKIMLRMISDKQEKRLKQVYNGPEEDFLAKKHLLLSAYKFMGTLNNHLSVPPAIFKKTEITELFGSPLNTSQSYCSPFKLEQELFSSNGSFFEYKIKPGLHVANPPFDETIMEDMADRLENQLDETPGVNIICVIPVWDPESQEKYGLKVYGKPFAAYTKLKNSKHFKQDFYLEKYKYPFWDYYKDKFTPASATHFIILSNTENLLFNPEKTLEDWKNMAPSSYKKY